MRAQKCPVRLNGKDVRFSTLKYGFDPRIGYTKQVSLSGKTGHFQCPDDSSILSACTDYTPLAQRLVQHSYKVQVIRLPADAQAEVTVGRFKSDRAYGKQGNHVPRL